MALAEILRQVARQATRAADIAEAGGSVDAYFQREAEAAQAKLTASTRLIEALPAMNGITPKALPRRGSRLSSDQERV